MPFMLNYKRADRVPTVAQLPGGPKLLDSLQWADFG